MSRITIEVSREKFLNEIKSTYANLQKDQGTLNQVVQQRFDDTVRRTTSHTAPEDLSLQADSEKKYKLLGFLPVPVMKLLARLKNG